MRGTPVKWTKKLLARLGKELDTDIARSMGVVQSAVWRKRTGLGIPEFKSSKWTPEVLARLGKEPDGDIARAMGVSRQAVQTKRQCLGIPKPSSVTWTPELLSRLAITQARCKSKALGESAPPARNQSLASQILDKGIRTQE